jgi:hypothetical protein
MKKCKLVIFSISKQNSLRCYSQINCFVIIFKECFTIVDDFLETSFKLSCFFINFFRLQNQLLANFVFHICRLILMIHSIPQSWFVSRFSERNAFSTFFQFVTSLKKQKIIFY